jgi:hypothetical protein
LKIVVSSYDFVWVDVACIDQENEVMKMDKINHPTAIFQQAKGVYACMTSWTSLYDPSDDYGDAQGISHY